MMITETIEIEPDVGDGNRDKVYSLLRCYHWFNRASVEVWGDPLSGWIVAAIAMAELEGTPHDATSLSASMRLPMQTIARRVVTLAEEGLVRRERDGRSYRLFLTDTARERGLSRADEAYDQLESAYTEAAQARQGLLPGEQ